MLTKLRRLVVGISKHLLLIQLLDSKHSERIPFQRLVHELVNVIQHAIPLPMRTLLHQLLPLLTVLRSERLYSTPLQLHTVPQTTQLLSR